MAYLHRLYGELYLDRRDSEGARAQLDAAAAIFRQLGLQTQAERTERIPAGT